MNRLSDNFDDAEFACHCGRCGLSIPTPALVTGLEELRSIIGRPIRILSGWRCPARNRAVGGAADSQHLVGRAADIAVDGVDLLDLAEAAVGVPEFRDGGVGIYPDGGFIHVDCREGKVARWGHVGGRYVAWLDAIAALEGVAAV